MMWGDKTGNDADLAAVKPDAIIFLKVPPSVARSWLKKELGNSSRSEVEHQYLTIIMRPVGDSWTQLTYHIMRWSWTKT